MSEQRNDGPQWVPYQPPPPSGKERAWRFIRRAAFPVMLLLFVGGLGALFYLSPQLGPDAQSMRRWLGMEQGGTPTSRTTPPSALDSAMDARRPSAVDAQENEFAAGGLGSGYAQLSVFTEPSGATVLVDGDSIGTTPLNRHMLRSGVYIITVQKDGFFAADTVAILRNNQAPTYSAVLNPRPELPADDEMPTLAEEQPSADEPSGTATSPASNPVASSENEASQPATPPTSDTGPPATSPDPVEPTPTTGSLRFTSTPSGALVQLDGDVVGTTPFVLDEVEAGRHEVVFTRSGYDTSRTQVTLAPQEERAVEGTLNRLMGRLRVLVRPWGSIYIDGRLRERNIDVWFEVRLPAGEHEVAAVHPALGRQTRTVTLGPGERRSITIDLRNPSPDTQNDVSAGGAPPDTSNRDRPS